MYGNFLALCYLKTLLKDCSSAFLALSNTLTHFSISVRACLIFKSSHHSLKRSKFIIEKTLLQCGKRGTESTFQHLVLDDTGRFCGDMQLMR